MKVTRSMTFAVCILSSCGKPTSKPQVDANRVDIQTIVGEGVLGILSSPDNLPYSWLAGNRLHAAKTGGCSRTAIHLIGRVVSFLRRTERGFEERYLSFFLGHG